MARGQACRRASELRWRSGGWERAVAGRAFLRAARRRRRPRELAAAGPALHLPGQSGCSAPAARGLPVPGAGPRGRGRRESREGARGGAWAPSLPSATRVSAA